MSNYYLCAVWAAGFKTPAGSSTFFYFFSFSLAESAERNKKLFASWHFNVCSPDSMLPR
jgi:hypothetical protein